MRSLALVVAFIFAVVGATISAMPLHGFAQVNIGGQMNRHSEQASDDTIHPTVEIEGVWGCGTPSRERQTTSGCMEGASITIRGRHFGQDSARVFLIPVDPKVPTALTGTPVPCIHTHHSTMLPSLLLVCTLPAAAEGASFHLRVVARNGISALHRNSVHYAAAATSADASAGASATDSKLRLIDPARWVELGVGGLGKQFKQLFRRAFGSRLAAVNNVATSLEIRHVKGVIFYGLPGTGKTLVARKVAEALGSKHVRVVNGPELMSKFVGESEKNLRELFSDAEEEWKEKGAKSELYVIIIDEIDGIMRSRTDRSSGDDSAARAVYDSVTTQLLAYMDGVKTVNNLLIMGLTNRLDALDPALLRPGRFEVQIRFPLPDTEGRKQILGIHTQNLVKNNYLASDVDLQAIAESTASFSGADLAATVRSATSYALERVYDTALAPKDGSTPAPDPPPFIVTFADLKRGVKEVLHAKAASANTEAHLRHGFVVYNQDVQATIDRLKKFADGVMESKIPVMTKVLLEGPSESGLTAVAAAAACLGQFPHVHVISPDAYLGMNADEKMNRIRSIFEAALQAPAACIVLDNLEGLLELGSGRMSNLMQRDLAQLLRRNPAFVAGGSGSQESEARLLVIVTSSSAEAVRSLSSTTTSVVFDAVEPVLSLRTRDIAAVLRHYNVQPTETDTLRGLAASLPPAVGIKRLVSWIQLAAVRAKAAPKGPVRPATGDLFPAAAGEVGEAIPINTLRDVLIEFGVLEVEPPKPAASTTSETGEGSENDLGFDLFW